jgi:hypothetical protein
VFPRPQLRTADGSRLLGVRLSGMGPKLLLSDVSTADQGVLRWRLRVRGNTAVEFGVVPVGVEVRGQRCGAGRQQRTGLWCVRCEVPAPTCWTWGICPRHVGRHAPPRAAPPQPSHTCLHKGDHAPGRGAERCSGFASAATAGSQLGVRVPVVRGTVLELLARRGRLEVLATYPPGATEASWRNGATVATPYRGPASLRFEVDFPDWYDVRLGATSWAKAQFDVLHAGFELDPAWPADAAAAAEAAAQPQPQEGEPQLDAAPGAKPTPTPEAALSEQAQAA